MDTGARSSRTTPIGLTATALTALIIAGIAGCATEQERAQTEPVPEIYATTPPVADTQLAAAANGSVQQVVAAGVRALNNLNMAGAEGAVTGTTGHAIATTPDGEHIVVEVSRLGETQSQFTVSITEPGHEELLRRIEARTLSYLQNGQVNGEMNGEMDTGVEDGPAGIDEAPADAPASVDDVPAETPAGIDEAAPEAGG